MDKRAARMARILVVDDDPNMVGILCTTLARAGYSVERTARGQTALEMLEKDASVDLLLTDVKMPGIDGFGLARTARQRRPALRIVYISGNPMQVQAVDQGDKFGPVLPKTISGEHLLAAIEKALASPPEPAR